jgi:putative nucleotidyltransferase with HDIG domain
MYEVYCVDAKKQLLLVEDDETFRKVIRNVVEMLGFEVREAENGLVAKTIFDLNSKAFDLIMSDVRMPEMDGIEFLKHVRASNKNVKFILMTGFSELIEAHQAYEIGANEFLAKPFRLENLKKVFVNVFAPPKEAVKPKEPELKFCRIPVEDFITSSKLLVDLHVRLSGEKYIKIAHAGDVVSVERLKMYKEKKVDYFYVKPEELRKLVGLNLMLNKAAGGVKVSEEAKLKLLTNTMSLMTQSAYFNGVNKDSLADATQIMDNTLAIISDDSTMMSLLEFLQNGGDQMYQHTVAVSVYSCMIAKTMGHRSTMTQTKLAMGGLMHDIGKKELPPELLTKNRIQMSAAEIQLYETHPQRGKDILGQIAGIPDDVISIVAHHHENNVGTGFPYHLPAKNIHPLAKIVAVADCFITTLFKMDAKNPEAVKMAIKKMATIHSMEYDPLILKALAGLFNVNIDKLSA